METKLYSVNNSSDTDFNFWFCYPAINSFALSSLGFLWLLKESEETEKIRVEKITTETEKTLIKPQDVNLIAFSISFDFDFLGVFKILEKYNIPFKATERSENYPLVFAGGIAVSANPEPYRDIFDFFIIGDGEEINAEVIKLIRNMQDKHKNEILNKLAELEGIYVPSLHAKKVKKLTKKLDKIIYSTILSDEAYFKNTFVIEIERGCANCCKFCLASYLNLPIRHTDFEELKKVIDFGLQYTNKIAFLGAQVSAHPKFKEICAYMEKKHLINPTIEMNFSSLRVDAITPEIIKTLVNLGQKNITLAIEAGSERLRKFINKNVTEEQIFNALKIIKENGLKGVKIYGMIGIPTETEEDIEALVDLGKRIKKEFSPLDISFGISTFVPKAHTPFQRFGHENIKILEKKSNYITKEFKKSGINVSITSAKWDYWQALISRGDGSLGQFLIDTYKYGGNLGAFKKAAKINNINSDYFASVNWAVNEKLPWSFIELKSS